MRNKSKHAAKLLHTVFTEKSTGRKYIMKGKKRVFIGDNMSERDLIKFLVTTFLKKKKYNRKKKDKNGKVEKWGSNDGDVKGSFTSFIPSRSTNTDYLEQRLKRLEDKPASSTTKQIEAPKNELKMIEAPKEEKKEREEKRQPRDELEIKKYRNSLRDDLLMTLQDKSNKNKLTDLQAKYKNKNGKTPQAKTVIKRVMESKDKEEIQSIINLVKNKKVKTVAQGHFDILEEEGEFNKSASVEEVNEDVNIDNAIPSVRVEPIEEEEYKNEDLEEEEKQLPPLETILEDENAEDNIHWRRINSSERKKLIKKIKVMVEKINHFSMRVVKYTNLLDKLEQQKDDYDNDDEYEKEIQRAQKRKEHYQNKLQEAIEAKRILLNHYGMEGYGKLKNEDDPGLSTDQINLIMKPYEPIYKGCVASDEINNGILPQLNSKTKKLAFVMNIDRHNQPGSHWVSVYIDNNKNRVEYYNSLGDGKDEQIPNHVLKALIKIIKKISPDDQESWKFKFNSEADQSAKTSNCGWFATKFLIDRMNDVPFKIAAGHENKAITRGESRIERFKKKYKHIIKQNKQSQKGDGILSDIYNKAKDVGKAVYERAKYIIKGPSQRTPKLNNFLEKNGNLIITSIMVCRTPVNSIIQNLVNVATLGDFQKKVHEAGYDNIYHLFMLLKMSNGKVIKLEKNQTVQIDFVSSADSKEFKQINDVNMSLNSFFQNAEKKVNLTRLYVYDPVTQNCQVFLSDMLRSSGLLTKDLSDFINQSAEKLLDKDGIVHDIMRRITDAANTASVALTGGEKKRKKKS